MYTIIKSQTASSTMLHDSGSVGVAILHSYPWALINYVAILRFMKF